MISIEATEARHTLTYQSYVKAHLEINKTSEKPSSLLPEYYMYVGDEAVFCNYAPAVLHTLCEATMLDKPDPLFSKLIENMSEDIASHFTLEIGGVFHFGLLMDNLHLFTGGEQAYWRGKVAELFLGFDNQMCYNMFNFYEQFFKTQFMGGDSEFFQQFWERMKFTYVFVADFEWHSIEDYGPKFMSNFLTFSKEYRYLYERLVEDIQQKRKVLVSA